jgi:hypothetical protein
LLTPFQFLSPSPQFLPTPSQFLASLNFSSCSFSPLDKTTLYTVRR